MAFIHLQLHAFALPGSIIVFQSTIIPDSAPIMYVLAIRPPLAVVNRSPPSGNVSREAAMKRPYQVMRPFPMTFNHQRVNDVFEKVGKRGKHTDACNHVAVSRITKLQ